MRQMTAETARMRASVLTALNELQEPCTNAKIAAATGLPLTQVYLLTAALTRQGYIVRIRRGVYQDADAHHRGVTPSDAAESSEADTGMQDWWRQTAEAEITATIAKIEEYGGDDLTEIGLELAAIAGLEEVSAADAAELAVFFYLRGKMARWASAIRRGQAVSDDTIHDIGVYARMAQWIRVHGGLV